MAEQDGDTWYCYYAVMKLRWKPSEFAFLPDHERALVMAFIDQRLEEEKQARKRLESSTSSARRGRR